MCPCAWSGETSKSAKPADATAEKMAPLEPYCYTFQPARYWRTAGWGMKTEYASLSRYKLIPSAQVKCPAEEPYCGSCLSASKRTTLANKQFQLAWCHFYTKAEIGTRNNTWYNSFAKAIFALVTTKSTDVLSLALRQLCFHLNTRFFARSLHGFCQTILFYPPHFLKAVD